MQRTYDHAGLQALLEGWELEELTVARQLDPKTWVVAEVEPSSTAEGACVALVDSSARSLLAYDWAAAPGPLVVHSRTPYQ